MGLHVAHLDRGGVRAQQELAVREIERVVHRPRRMVLRLVERGEVVVIGLDLGAVGDFEAERVEQRLHALERAADWMDAAETAPAAGQRYIERFFGEARFQAFSLDRFTPCFQRRLESFLGGVDAAARRRALCRGKLAKALGKLRQRTGATEIARLDLLELVGVGDAGERLQRFVDYGVDVFHKRKRRPCEPPFLSRPKL
jgi:hypothetical protein